MITEVYLEGMTALEIQDLARNWIRYQEAWERVGGPCRECTELQWAYNLVDDMVIDRPEAEGERGHVMYWLQCKSRSRLYC